MLKMVILGIGQSLRRDDSAGLTVVARWQEVFPAQAADPDVGVELLELPGLELLRCLEKAERALIVDAVHSGATPGDLYLLSEADLAGFGSGTGSAHGWGVAEILVLGRQLYPEMMPDRVEILGIEVGDVGMGQQLSSEVARAIDDAANMIEKWVKGAEVKG
jgi:hydrogenase maturation protease